MSASLIRSPVFGRPILLLDTPDHDDHKDCTAVLITADGAVSLISDTAQPPLRVLDTIEKRHRDALDIMSELFVIVTEADTVVSCRPLPLVDDNRLHEQTNPVAEIRFTVVEAPDNGANSDYVIGFSQAKRHHPFKNPV